MRGHQDGDEIPDQRHLLRPERTAPFRCFPLLLAFHGLRRLIS